MVALIKGTLQDSESNHTQEDELNWGPANGRQEGEWGVCTGRWRREYTPPERVPSCNVPNLLDYLIGGIFIKD